MLTTDRVELADAVFVVQRSRRIAVQSALARANGRLAPEQLEDLRSCLYGLNTVRRLRFSQEEENYFSLAP